MTPRLPLVGNETGSNPPQVCIHYFPCAWFLSYSVAGTPDLEPSGSRPRQDSEVPTEGAEEGEAMDATNDDDTAMMSMMGLTGFGTTKVSTHLRYSRSARNSVVGETRRGQSRRRCKCQEAADMAPVHESVRVSSIIRERHLAN